MTKRTLYLCGAGNSEGVRLAQRINESESRWHRLVLLDDDPAKADTTLLGVRVAGPFDLLASADADLDEVQNLVARTTAGRESARQRIARYGVPFASLIAPHVDTAGVNILGDVIVYHNATLGPESTLNQSTVVFMGAVVGHESELGRGCVVASNAVLNARVRLGDHVYIGSNAVVLPEMTIGPGATIGAGAAIVTDIPAGATAFGRAAEVVPPEIERIGRMLPASGTTALQVMEEAVAEIWKNEAGLIDFGPNDNFFDVGGSSLLALKVMVSINAATGSELSISDFYRFPTVRLLAAHVGGSRRSSAVYEGEIRGAIRRRYSGWGR